MNNCSICGREKSTLTDIETTTRGVVGICPDCLSMIVVEAIEERERWRKSFCKGCAQAILDGCAQGVTPETCA